MAALPEASADTGNAPSVDDVAVWGSQEKLAHCFLDAARRLTFQFKFKIHFPLFQANNLRWAQMVEMLETRPNLVHCMTSEMRWITLMHAQYVARSTY